MDAPHPPPPSGSLPEDPAELDALDRLLADVVLRERRREIEAVCTDAERAVAIRLLGVWDRFDRVARFGDAADDRRVTEASVATDARETVPVRRG